MGTMAAKITDPLQGTAKFKRARAKVQRIKDNKDKWSKPVYKQKLKQARKDRNAIKNKYSDKRADVAEFDTQWMWDKVKDILRPNNPLNQAFDQLHESNDQLNDALGQTNQMMEGMANNQALLQADAMRMSLLLGAPLPDKAADHVLVGDQRGEVDPKDRGRRSLRIEQTTPSLAI